MQKAAEKLLKLAGVDYSAVKEKFDDWALRNVDVLEELLGAVDDDETPF
ncbi:MAG: hypothetical protein NZ941_02390 [Candidatus Caldarchaeum sp.]|nr:hypothetical protein [Candidatus Caldarchaeum sp.]